MITRLIDFFRRRPPKQPPVMPETPATMKSQEANRSMEATTSRIDSVLADADRIESLRRIRRTGNFAEGWIVPDRPEGNGHD
jgi:uncharacterized Zn finger protein (UPF0148 family)